MGCHGWALASGRGVYADSSGRVEHERLPLDGQRPPQRRARPAERPAARAHGPSDRSAIPSADPRRASGEPRAPRGSTSDTRLPSTRTETRTGAPSRPAAATQRRRAPGRAAHDRREAITAGSASMVTGPMSVGRRPTASSSTSRASSGSGRTGIPPTSSRSARKWSSTSWRTRASERRHIAVSFSPRGAAALVGRHARQQLGRPERGRERVPDLVRHEAEVPAPRVMFPAPPRNGAVSTLSFRRMLSARLGRFCSEAGIDPARWGGQLAVRKWAV